MALTRNRRRRSLSASPGFIPPQLATLVTQAPDGPGYLHEIKLDGYRMLGRVDSGEVRLLTRTGLDWTTKYPAVAELPPDTAAAARSPPERSSRYATTPFSLRWMRANWA